MPMIGLPLYRLLVAAGLMLSGAVAAAQVNPVSHPVDTHGPGIAPVGSFPSQAQPDRHSR